VTATPNPPLIHSLSYGSLAPEDPKIDIITFHTDMCKLGLKGLTLFVATGDDGVANFGARGAPSQCGFTPSFPATSPYCVAVGATQGPEVAAFVSVLLFRGSPAHDCCVKQMGQPEIACTSYTNGLITTGGGFSTYVNRPSWQNVPVNNYLTKGPNVPPRSMFSALGRAYPDIAMIGQDVLFFHLPMALTVSLRHNFPVFIGGSQYIESGTSASAPVMASMFALINGVRLAGGSFFLLFCRHFL
jgi:tripeptidyl-peptidase-1